MTIPILEVVDLHAAYGRIEVLRGVDLRIPKGAVMALLGPNGGGKSTLVKVISGQKKATTYTSAACTSRAPSPKNWPGSGCAPSRRAARCSRT